MNCAHNYFWKSSWAHAVISLTDSYLFLMQCWLRVWRSQASRTNCGVGNFPTDFSRFLESFNDLASFTFAPFVSTSPLFLRPVGSAKKIQAVFQPSIIFFFSFKIRILLISEKSKLDKTRKRLAACVWFFVLCWLPLLHFSYRKKLTFIKLFPSSSPSVFFPVTLQENNDHVVFRMPNTDLFPPPCPGKSSRFFSRTVISKCQYSYKLSLV